MAWKGHIPYPRIKLEEMFGSIAALDTDIRVLCINLKLERRTISSEYKVASIIRIKTLFPLNFVFAAEADGRKTRILSFKTLRELVSQSADTSPCRLSIHER